VGLDVPAELVRAAGFQPLRLTGHPDTASTKADCLLGKRVDPQIRSIGEALLNDKTEPLKGLLISHDNHSQLRLFNVLRAVRAQGALQLPPMHFCDLLHSADPACRHYNYTRLLELRSLLSKWAGRPVNSAVLRAEIRAANQSRAALREISALRRRTLPTQGRSRRIFLTGSSHDHAHIYRAIEAGGCVIVGEDHDWGDAGIDFDLDEHQDPFDAFLDRLALGPPASAKSSISQRAAYVVSRAMNADADAVVAYIREGDAGPRWDVAVQRNALEAAGLPLLLLDDQPYRLDGAALITAAVASFLRSDCQ
jgi:benzoyl-CoA reductase/2-hydroxyglutaryl-CoA dehydratase subunit BcrC/BadD/HgdB